MTTVDLSWKLRAQKAEYVVKLLWEAVGHIQGLVLILQEMDGGYVPEAKIKADILKAFQFEERAKRAL